MPDQRGYNLSDKPCRVKAYGREALVGDEVGLMDHFGYQQVQLAGYDWGGSGVGRVAAAYTILSAWNGWLFSMCRTQLSCFAF